MDWQVFGLSSLRQRARQRRFPPEFRILQQAPPVPNRLVPAATPQTVAVAAEIPAPDLHDAAMADVATNLWRSLKRFETTEGGRSTGNDMSNGAEDEAAARMRRMTTRNLRAIAERLDEAGVRIHDHDGVEFDIGMALEVIAYEPRPNLSKETVVETVRPSVYRAGQSIQIGQVIVGTPMEGQN
jgi:hypothetical protein